jgi:FkbM family methyltransferase
MKSVERMVEHLSPSAGVRLRVLKKKLHHDMTLRVLDRLVRPGDEVLDVGAYRGTYTVAMSRLVGPGGRVWAIEPFPPNAADLAKLTARRGNVTVCPWAASAQAGGATLTVPVFEGHRLGALATLGDVSVAGESVGIESRTLDDLLDGRDDPRPVSFIRCDVVGHERAVLEGAHRTLGTHGPSLFVEIEQRHQSRPVAETLELVRDHGYDGYFLRAGSFFPVAEFDVDRDQLSFLTSEFVPYGMPSGYVHYFLFVRPATVLDGLPVS